ncbi:MAG: hypothetical protein CMB99_05905 [Flavobacteriaceae bacterium]|nr:hypothetical protein [Flavobacteriaceae bacterium]|tara:strand:+ start:278 stop:796 length:519 start_codon:yes stop_codon:yes gene_type:complete
MRYITYLLLSLCIYFTSTFTSFSQNQPPNCSGEPYKQFDFWEGSWNVFDVQGNLIGTNKLIKMQNNCVMQENWESKKGPNRGTSYNYYDRTDQTWNQVWVDNSGFTLVLKGKFTDGKMILESKLQKTPQGNFYNRVTWYEKEDKSVMQIWERLDENKKVLNEIFRGIYKKNS